VKFKVKPLAFDSLGVRSTATLVEVCGYRVLVDPGVSYAPRRYGLPPHPLELEKVEKLRSIVHDVALKSDILVISHYHYDHYDPKGDFYSDKLVLLKHPLENINFSQKGRAHAFLKYNESIKNAHVEYADSKEFKIDEELSVKFSPPIPHGPQGSKLGFVIMTVISCGDFKFIHTSDVQGPMTDTGLDFIMRENPDLIFIGGPPTYMEKWRVDIEHIEKAINNLTSILSNVKAKVIVLDHHTLRDLNYKDRLKSLYDKARSLSKRLITAAEYLGVPVEPLEAMRKKLWGKE